MTYADLESVTQKCSLETIVEIRMFIDLSIFYRSGMPHIYVPHPDMPSLCYVMLNRKQSASDIDTP
jgi:hypothetical protein